MKAFKSLMTPGVAALAALLLSASPALASDADQARSKVEKAQDLMAEVSQKSDGWALWKSTNKVMGNAEQSLKQGDYEAAIEAADEVIFQAKKGLAQYREEQTEYDKAASAAADSGDLKEDAWAAGES